jgi:hypothetical protein
LAGCSFFFFGGVYPNNFFSRKKNVPGCGKQTYFSIQSLSLPCRVPIQTHAKVSIYNRQGEMEWVTLQTLRNLSLCEMEGRYLNMMMVVWCCMGPTWWVPRDGSILYLRPSPRDCLHGPSTLLFSCFSLWCHRCTVFSSVQCLSAYPGLVERNKRRKNMCEAARNLKFCRCCESKLVVMG